MPSAYSGTKAYTPKEGDTVILLVCCGAGPRLVLRVLADEFRCPSCRKAPEQAGSVILGRDGALPGRVV